MPTRLRNAEGQIVEVDDADVAFYAARGWTPESFEQATAGATAELDPEGGGPFGGTVAALSSGLSGLTVGLSDLAFGSVLSENERQRLSGARREHQGISVAGNIAGAVLPAIATGGGSLGATGAGRALAATPAGALSRISAGGFEAGRAIGGIRGAAVAAGSAGVEGAIQAGGQYLGELAIEDRELTAEGLSAALGAGFTFGAAGGAAALGIERGTIAARRMFSSADKVDPKVAAIEWDTEARKTMEANDAAAEAARAKLVEARAARQAAEAAKRQAAAVVDDVRAGRAPEVPPASGTPPADPVKLESDLLEYDQAKAALLETQQRVDQGLEDSLRGLQQLEINPSSRGGAAGEFDEGLEASLLALRDADLPVTPVAFQRSAVPTEFSGRGMPRTPEEIERYLAEAKESIGSRASASSGVDSTRNLRIAEGTPSPGALDATSVGKGPRTPAPALEPPPGIPVYDDLRARLDADGVDYVEATVPAREIAARGWYEMPGAGKDAVRAAKARKAVAEGAAEPIKLNVTPEGRITVTSGRNRLQAAVDADAPIKVKWSTGFEPADDLIRRGGAAAAPGPISDLEAQLLGTQRAIDSGQNLNEISAPRSLEDALRRIGGEDAIAEVAAARAGTGGAPETSGMAASEAEAQAAARQARKEWRAGGPARRRAREEARNSAQFRKLGIDPGLLPWRPVTVVEATAELAPAVTRYEAAAANLVESVGDAAPPAAQEAAAAFRAAEGEVERRTIERTARSVDDAIEAAAPPAPPSAKDRLAGARAAKAEADAALKAARAAEREASIAATAAKRTAWESKKAVVAAERPAREAAKVASREAQRQTNAAVGIAQDLPVVGPLLRRYLRYSALRAQASRGGGRVPATGMARAAAFAAKTRDAVASAVDRTLGVAGAAARASQPIVAPLAGVLSQRLFDDGEPDAPAKASLEARAAVRMREVAAAAADPQRVIAQVRRELRDVDDPDLVTAVANHRIGMYRFLAAASPRQPAPSPYARQDWQPSPAAAMKFARQVQAAFDPVAAFEALTARSLSPEAAETLRAVHPRLFGAARERCELRVLDINEPVPYEQRLQASLLFDAPLDPSREPGRPARLQAIYAPAPEPGPAAAQAPGAGPPAPSIAGAVNFMNMFQPDTTRIR